MSDPHHSTQLFEEMGLLESSEKRLQCVSNSVIMTLMIERILKSRIEQDPKRVCKYTRKGVRNPEQPNYLAN